MGTFKNEITVKEWLVGSGIVVATIWTFFLFPRTGSNAGIFTLTTLPYELWKHFAIYPRKWDSLLGILTMPLTHGSISHLTGNMGFLIIFMIILGKTSTRFCSIMAGLWVLTGILIWSLHPAESKYVSILGASGIVFALVGYLIPRLIFNKDLLITLKEKNRKAFMKMTFANLWISFVGISVLLAYQEVIINGVGFGVENGVTLIAHTLGSVAGITVYFIELAVITIKTRKQKKRQLQETKNPEEDIFAMI